jgi:AraC-like DNA-binding protein
LFDRYERFINNLDTTEARKVICQIEETAHKTGSTEWKLYASYFEVELFNMKRNLYGNHLFSVEELMKMATLLLEKTEKTEVIHLELMVRQRIIDFYWSYLKNYELAFDLYNIQEKRLEEVTLEEVPEMLDYYMNRANAHYFFKDYAQAIFYFNKVLEGRDNSRTQYPKQHARNGLGLSYRYGYNDFDRSDSCFFAMIQYCNINQEREFFFDSWNGIAEGSLGHNMFLRKEYDRAIPLLKSSLEKMLKHGDYGFSTGTAIDLANIYLKKGNIAEAKRYIDLSKNYYDKIPREGTLSRIYEALSKYYAATGNAMLSMAYMDSTVAENKKYEEQFSALQMMRAEQRKHLSEQKLKEEQLNAEKIKSDGYRKNLIITFIALLLIGGGLARYFVLYRKKKSAYRELVRKSQEWAKVSPPQSPRRGEDSLSFGEGWGEVSPPQSSQRREDPLSFGISSPSEGLGEVDWGEVKTPDETDLSIMKEIEKVMQEDKLYRNAELSMDLLTRKLHAKRHYISTAINRCTNKSFNTFVNEYRIKEAIQILSKNSTGAFTIDAIAFDVGFNNRINFYRVFKIMTGLSPTEFRKNVVQL